MNCNAQIERSEDIGPKYTDLAWKNLHVKRGAPQKVSFLSSLARTLAQWRQPKKFDA